MELEFKPWPKITRDNPFKATITEKIDGTNACVIIKDGEVVGVQSRKRFITPENDNFGFATWVEENKEELSSMGDGYHYGEWAGPGIQKNPHNLKEKTFFLFNTSRWGGHNPNTPSCCSVVPVLFRGYLEPDTIEYYLGHLEAIALPEETPEGIVVYYPTFGQYTKHTIKSPNGKWCKE